MTKTKKIILIATISSLVIGGTILWVEIFKEAPKELPYNILPKVIWDKYVNDE